MEKYPPLRVNKQQKRISYHNLALPPCLWSDPCPSTRRHAPGGHWAVLWEDQNRASHWLLLHVVRTELQALPCGRSPSPTLQAPRALGRAQDTENSCPRGSRTEVSTAKNPKASACPSFTLYRGHRWPLPFLLELLSCPRWSPRGRVGGRRPEHDGNQTWPWPWPSRDKESRGPPRGKG